MTTYPPPHAPGTVDSKGLYPSVETGPAQQPYPSVSYQAQPAGAPGYYPGPQQQPQQVYVSPPPATVVVARQPPQSFVVHIVVSCLVFWCCGCLCGLIAFILASKSRRYSLQHRLISHYMYTSCYSKTL